MRRIIVSDEMEIEVLWRIAIDGAQEAQKLLMTMPIHARADDLSARHVERSEQRRRAVSLVIMGHGSGSALFHRQAGLSAIERLYLALLVDRQNQRFVGRVQIEAHDIGDFLGEIRIARQLECSHKMRF